MEKRNNWFKRKLIVPLLDLLKQGISPSKLSLALTLGFLLAVFPVFGSHTLLCFLIIWLFRLNPAAVFLINNLSYPLIFVTYLPFIRMGEWIFNAPTLPFSIPQILEMIKDSPWNAIMFLWDATMQAIIAWGVVAIIAFPLIFVSLRFIIAKTLGSVKQNTSTTES